jgi:hypothetical protein
MRLPHALMILALLALAVPAADASAQARPGVRMIIGVGGGRGGAKFDCDGCLSQRQNEPSGYFRIGRRIGQSFVVGGEVNAWRTKNSDKTGGLWLSAIDAFAQFYPRPGFFVQGGVGLGLIRKDIDVTDQGVGFNLSQTATGLGFHAGAGYEFQIAPHVAVAPFATYFGTSGLVFDDIGDENGQVYVLGIGLVVN